MPAPAPSSKPQVTAFQARVYDALCQIPRGRVSTYADLAAALGTSPRAVGGALRRNPFAPRVPCHRIIQANHYLGGFMGEWQKAPSGVNQTKKLKILKEEGVTFDSAGMLHDTRVMWKDFRVKKGVAVIKERPLAARA